MASSDGESGDGTCSSDKDKAGFTQGDRVCRELRDLQAICFLFVFYLTCTLVHTFEFLFEYFLFECLFV